MADTATTPAGGALRHFLTFRLDDRHYALPAEEIAEVIRIPDVARLPQSPPGLLGLANLRGAILPVASGRSLLGQERVAASSTARAIVMNDAAPIALAVDAVTALVALPAAELETRPAQLAALPGEMIQGVFQSARDGKTVKLLDIRGLMATAFAARQRTARATKQGPAENLLRQEQVQAAQIRLVAFAVAGQEYALPLAVVQEIVTAPELLAAVPHSEALVLGVAGFRDGLLPLLSLRGLLGFPPSAAGREREKVVVVSLPGGLVGLVVDEMRAIFSADETRMDEIPDVLAARIGGESRIKAIYRGAHGLISILAPEQLFGEEVMQKLGAARSSIPASENVDEKIVQEMRQFLVFRLGEEEFGLPIETVEEVARVPETIARVPKTPKFLEGVVNLRGEVLPVVDQRKRFNMPALGDKTGRRLIVVRSQRHLAGLIVDGVSEVLRSTVGAIEPAPDLAGETNKLVQGVINLEAQKRIVLLLDPAELLTRAEHGLLDAFGSRAPEPPKA